MQQHATMFGGPLWTGTIAALALALAFTVTPVLADNGGRRVSVDVAMIGPTFFDFEENPDPARAGIPPNGSPFVIQGYVYRGGTFRRYGDTSGVNADGSPEFPNRVIGKWICRGWHLQDGDALSGPVVATTQVFDFAPDKPGTHIVVTDGFELADFDLPFKRAITGGTGVFKRIKGEVRQTYVWDDPLFLNESGGFNTTFEFEGKQAVHVALALLHGR